MSFLQKIQNLPESKRKVILWTIVIIISLVLLIFWVQNSQKVLRSFPKEEIKEKFQTPFQEKLKEMPEIEMPEIEMPEISEEEVKQLEEMMKEIEEEKSKSMSND